MRKWDISYGEILLGGIIASAFLLGVITFSMIIRSLLR